PPSSLLFHAPPPPPPLHSFPTRRSSDLTTFASNAARLKTLGHVARDTGRQVCVAGRSLDRILRVSKSVGYLTDFPETIDFDTAIDRKSTRLNSSHVAISYAVFCLKKKKN